MRRTVVLLLLIVSVLGLGASTSGAQVVPPRSLVPDLPGTGDTVQVGPPRCALGETVQGAFLNFHENVHTGTPATTGGLVFTPSFCP